MTDRKQTLHLENQDFTFLGKGSRFLGDWELTGPSFIAGKMQGKITMHSDSPLTLEREGQFEGEFKGADFHLYGQFSGKIFSTATVTIHTNAEIEGTIHAKNIVIQPGARANIEAITGIVL